VIAVVAYVHAQFPSHIPPQKVDEKKKLRFLTPISNNYALVLLAISMTGAVTGLLIDFQFYAAAASANMGSKGNTSFFANFYIILNFSSLLLQLFATPKIQDKVGLRGGLMVLPLALIGGATFVTATATALSRSVLRVTEGGLRSSVHRSIWEQAFIPLDSSDRSSVKIAVDGMGARNRGNDWRSHNSALAETNSDWWKDSHAAQYQLDRLAHSGYSCHLAVHHAKDESRDKKVSR